jgi:hypothetical protein
MSVEHDIPTQTTRAKVFAYCMVNAPIFARMAATVMEWIGVVADDDIEQQHTARRESGKAGLKKIVVSECIGPGFLGVTEHFTECRNRCAPGQGEFSNVAMIQCRAGRKIFRQCQGSCREIDADRRVARLSKCS